MSDDDWTAPQRASHRPDDSASASVSEPAPHPVRSRTRSTLIAVILFLLTCGSTFLAGSAMGPVAEDTLVHDLLWNGISYSGPIMLILLCHEMGHYLTARFHRVPASPPFFIPLPVIGLFGTLGAVIVQPRGFVNRKVLFDIAVAGPLAGIVVALPVAWFGLQQATVQEFTPDVYSTTFGDPLILKAMVWLRFGELPPQHDVLLNPLFFAGWVGIFLTGLNLVPIGQLDGGHILYGLLGKRAHRVSYAMLMAGVAYMAYFNHWSYVLMILLLVMTGVKHPPTSDDQQRLGWGRMLLGWATMSLFFVCFTPFPITINEPQLGPPQQEEQPAREAELTVMVPQIGLH